MDLSKYDAVLVCETPLNEGYGDDRYYNGAGYGRDGGNDVYYNYDDPKLYAGNAFGKLMLQELNGWRTGYSASVTDFGKWVVVDVKCHNHVTGRSATKTFLVVFTGGPKGTDKGGGLVMSTANKWRSISGYSQAVSYIKSAASTLETTIQTKI